MKLLAPGLGVALACGGKSNQITPSGQGGSGVGAAAGSNGEGAAGAQGGIPAMAGNLGVGAEAGSGGVGGSSEPAACEPGSPAVCEDGAVVSCTPSGQLMRLECNQYSECSLEGVAHCEPIDQPLGNEPNEFGFTWRDAFMLLPCYSVSGHDCLTIPSDQTCPNQDAANWEDKGVIFTETFEIGGDVGKLYEAHLVVNGVVSGKYYERGTRDDGTSFVDAGSETGADAFYRGGRPLPSSYDVWQITVRHGTGEVFGHYYLNSFPQNSGLESHQSARIGFEKDIEVPGGGTIEYRVHDSNCRAIDNCGFNEIRCIGWHVPNEPDLVLPETWQGEPLASYNVVNGAQQPFHSQLVHLRVTKVTYLEDIEPIDPAEACSFADANLTNALLVKMGKPGPLVSRAAAANVIMLELGNQGVQSLQGIDCLVNLQSLKVIHDPALGELDLTPLGELEHLEILSVVNNTLTDIQDLEPLTQLKSLELSSALLENLESFGALVQLEELKLAGGNLTDISALASLPALKSLDLNSSQLTSIAPLSSVTTLETSTSSRVT